MRVIQTVRSTPLRPADSFTPSAQNRLDRQFRAQTTPTPASTGGISTAPPRPSDIDVTVGATAPPGAASGSRALPQVGEARAGSIARPSAPARPAKSRLPLFLGAFVLVLAAAGYLLFAPGPSPSPQEAAHPQVTAAPAVEAAPQPTATEAPAPEPTLAPPEPAPPAAAAGVAEVGKPLRPPAEEARGRAARSRVAADRAHAEELAKGPLEEARSKEREAQRLFNRGNYAAAKVAFELASQLFESAEIAASNAAALKSRREAERIAALQPTRPIEAVRPTALPQVEPTRLPATAIPTLRVPSEAERIAEVLRAYEKAQSTLDAALYARVYAGLTAEGRQQVADAWQGLRSQEVKLECQPPKIAGASADVTCFERRVAVPKVGTEQRNDTNRSLHLEKRGDTWVITGMR